MSLPLFPADPPVPDNLLSRDHTLIGGVLFGLEGYPIEIQARAVRALRRRRPWAESVRISGMARESIYESLDRITGAFSTFQIPHSPAEILVNLAPPDLPKEGTWLDLPLAVILLQAAGLLRDLPETTEKELVRRR